MLIFAMTTHGDRLRRPLYMLTDLVNSLTLVSDDICRLLYLTLYRLTLLTCLPILLTRPKENRDA